MATQWAAEALGHQPQLGQPWFLLSGRPVYRPWSLFPWWFSFDAYAPEIFRKAGMIAATGGVLGALSAVIGSVWRARQSKLVPTYGSARWAGPRALNRPGLIGRAGLFLGTMGADYLRHDGPHTVQEFAPTHRGTGPRSVVPT